jgi:hypothetical protein
MLFDMNDRKTSDVDIQIVVRQINYESQEAMLLQMTKNWSVADFIYAIDRLEVDQPTGRREQLRGLYRTLRVEREAVDARRSSEEANAKRHAELSARLEDLKSPHWSVVPNFRLTVAILVLTAIGVIIAVIALFR